MNPNIQTALDLIDEALCYLEESEYAKYFEKMNKVKEIPQEFKPFYADLKKLFISGKTDHHFNQRLETLTSEICQFLKENCSEIKIDSNEDIFSVLSSLDFKSQENKFLGLLKKRNFATFLVRGDQEMGQTWLIHQLIKKAMPTSQVIRVENVINKFLEDIIDTLNGIACAKLKQNDENDLKLQKIAEKLASQITQDYAIIITKPNFINTSEFHFFCEHFIKHITQRIEVDHKIVLFLKDEETITCSRPDSVKYWCYNDCVEDEITFLEKWERETNLPYLINLHKIGSFDPDFLWEWVKDCTELSIRKELKDKAHIEKLWSEKYENGNPHKILAHFSEILDYKDSWQTKY